MNLSLTPISSQVLVPYLNLMFSGRCTFHFGLVCWCRQDFDTNMGRISVIDWALKTWTRPLFPLASCNLLLEEEDRNSSL